MWTQDRFDDFRLGRFGDAGTNAYVSHRHIQQIHKQDLNRDGNIDLVFVNSHPQEKSSTR